MGSDDLIDFEIIEGQKENIQSLPGGRSAKKLVDVFSPSQPLHKLATPTPTDSKNINDCIRAEYEAEVENLAESDDPLDIFDRYVQWTLDAYPSAQATPQSGLHTLLERATKTFVSYPQYKNDPRYLKLWIHYIHFFSDAPRETFVYLARHGIGDSLALFYEEYAAWLEGAGRWGQSEEVYKLGLEYEARPAARLLRKFGEFQQRLEQQPDAADGPSSPALPTVRPALAAKVDPFAAPTRPHDPQVPRPNMGVGGGGGGAAKPSKSKLAIFSDADAAYPAMGSGGPDSKGWDTIGSISERKKENVMEPKPWAGEVLKAGGKKSSGPKMAIFRDPHQVTVNAHSGKKERVSVDLSLLYPYPDEPGSERCFEEVWAMNRGWLDVDFDDDSNDESQHVEEEPPRKIPVFSDESPDSRPQKGKMTVFADNEPPQGRSIVSIFSDKSGLDVDLLSEQVSEKLVIHRDGPMVDENGVVIASRPAHGRKKAIEVNETMVVREDIQMYDENGATQDNGRNRKKKVIEINETQTIKAKLDSPTGPKMPKRKRSQGAEPTMTIHTKEAMGDIYDIFNDPSQQQPRANEDEYEIFSDSEGDYTSGGENTTRNIGTGDAGDGGYQNNLSPTKSESEWSDFTARKHIPNLDDTGVCQQDETLSSGRPTPDRSQQANISKTPDDIRDEADELVVEEEEEDDDSVTASGSSPPRTRTIFIPIPPEDYVAPTRPYRDPVEVANNRLPFMTPITERTESSLGVATSFQQQYYDPKTLTPSKEFSSPGRPHEEYDDDGDEMATNEEFTEPLSNPLRDVVTETIPSAGKILQLQLEKPRPASPIAVKKPLAPKVNAPKVNAPKVNAPKGPIITDIQCNPVDEQVRHEILEKMVPGLSSYDGFFDHRDEDFPQFPDLKKWAKAGSTKCKAEGTVLALNFPNAKGTYTLKRVLGAGAFAPVYLVENSDAERAQVNDENTPVAIMGQGAFASAHAKRNRFEALKAEQDPPSAWEFHMIRLAHSRLGAHERAARSLTTAMELHLFKNSSFLLLPFHPYSTLLEVVNFMHSEGLMEEQLAMFFAIELVRTTEVLHAKGIAHGDIKIDNCLLRLDHQANSSSTHNLDSRYRPDGSEGWGDRGLVLIDFGRGIDMRAFHKDVAFIADWEYSSVDPIEIREGRPWTWQIDYHGLASTIHCILFGKYMDISRADSGGLPGAGGRRYKIKESLKRYWQTDIWASCFETLLNPVAGAKDMGEEGGKMPLIKGMKKMRTEMEEWLEKNCERGTGLRGLLTKVEAFAVANTKRRSL
ncbi:hypothetical protein MKZ38_002817 [Zalerion maritima]|uniref:Uncharacterized protein n=1 Tax=Zalerion maritima TaxID=339359 RepID=A0AAD5WQZ7_9PEZI|nr:hypothetical protein MKZ38_002817 [Zalerion maritima]